jgi:hypothetical protein
VPRKHRARALLALRFACEGAGVSCPGARRAEVQSRLSLRCVAVVRCAHDVVCVDDESRCVARAHRSFVQRAAHRHVADGWLSIGALP